MPKVKFNKSIKVDGKFVRAGDEIEVSAKVKKTLEDAGHIGESKKNGMPSNEKEIKDLVAKVADLEKQVKDGGNDELAKEIETLKADLEKRDETIGTLTGEIETLKADLEKATKK